MGKRTKWTIRNINDVAAVVYNAQEGAREAQARGDKLELAKYVRDWAGTNVPHCDGHLLLDHDHIPLPDLVEQVLNFEGGCWCGGIATVYRNMLHVFNIPAAGYTYGHYEKNISHTTTLVSDGTGRVFIRDPYFGYHYENLSGGELEFGRLMRLVMEKRYDEIVTVFDAHYLRPVVGLAGDDGIVFTWLYDDYKLPEPTDYEDRRVWSGGHVSYERLYAVGADNRTRIDQIRGEQPMREFLFDLMLVNPIITRFTPRSLDSYPEWKAMQNILLEIARCNL